ncbi:hypothetical protein ES703_48414 [subsurface metagenome]
MKPGIEGKINRVCQHYDIRRKGRKKVVLGPYWFGYWQENGKTKTGYIGKELPEGLKFLLERRFKKPGNKYYTWPGRNR